MKKTNNFLIVVLVSLVTISCSIKGSFQGLFSYYSTTKSKNPHLLLRPDDSVSICDSVKPEPARVYIVNGEKLKACLAKIDKALIYVWAPKCKGRFCYSLNAIQEKCDLKNIELFIVAEYYDNDLMEKSYQIKRPILGIDVEYYNSNRTSEYLSAFMNDVNAKRDLPGRFMYFENGLLKTIFESIEEI